MSSSQQQTNNHDQEAQNTRNESSNFQIVEQEIETENEMRAKRDIDARFAEDELRRERDQEARQNIDAAIAKAIVEATERVISNINQATEQMLINSVSDSQRQLNQRFEERFETFSNEIFDAAKVRIDWMITANNKEIKDRGYQMLSSLTKEIKIDATKQIEEAISVIHELRDRQIKAVEQIYPVDVKGVLNTTTQAVSKLNSAFQANSDIINQAQANYFNLFTDWMNRISQKQQEIIEAKTIYEKLQAQQNIVVDTTRTSVDLYIDMMTIGSKAILKMISASAIR